MKAFNYTCPNCKYNLVCDETFVGQVISCPLCGESFLLGRGIPDPAQPANKTTPGQAEIPCQPVSPDLSFQKNFSAESSELPWGKYRIDPVEVQFKTPILSKILYVVAGFHLAAAFFVLLGFVIELFMSGRANKIWFLLFIWALLPIPIMIGSAQLINFIGKICCNGNKIVMLLQLLTAQSKK